MDLNEFSFTFSLYLLHSAPVPHVLSLSLSLSRFFDKIYVKSKVHTAQRENVRMCGTQEQEKMRHSVLQQP